MSETLTRQRPSVEQHLQPSHQSCAYEDDLLAEATRIVCEQPDPSSNVVAQQAAIAVQNEELRPSHDPHGCQGQEPLLGGTPPRLSGDFAAIEAGLRGALAAPQPAQSQPPSLYMADPHADPHDGYGYEPEAQYHHEPKHAAPQTWAEPAKPSRSGWRRPVYAMTASIAIAIVGIGVAFAYKGTGSSPRDIKTIMAAASPTKERPPADQPAATDANASQQPSTKLVRREEQPVDLAQAVPDRAAAPAAMSSDRAGSPQFPTQAPKSASRTTNSAHRVAAAHWANDGATDDAQAPALKPAKPVKVASAEVGAVAADEPKTSGSGSFAVQLAASGSEPDARSATSSLLKEYGGALHGRKLGFHRAEANGRTVYRVRVSSLTRDDAASLCSELKADGGNCFVAKN